MADYWDSAFAGMAADSVAAPSGERPGHGTGAGHGAAVGGGPACAPESPERGLAGADTGDPGPIAMLQSVELKRLARENERLMDRIETLLELQQREQVLRQQLQNRLDRLSERVSLPAPALDGDAIRREASAGVSEEIKPVLFAILELLERAVPRPEPGPRTRPEERTEAPRVAGEFQKLPEILTRPIEDLISSTGQRASGRKGSADEKQPSRGIFTAGPGASRPNPNQPRPSMPDVFAWTNVLS